MKVFSLMYHDVIPPGGFRDSGMEGADADLYKLDRDDFRRHMDALGSRSGGKIGTCAAAFDSSPLPVFLTFDDGGASTSWIADEMEHRGWRGHFFIVTDWIGARGFVTAAELRSLHARGHVIGSHSCSHPRRISLLTRDEIYREWRESADTLSALLGAPATVASVPGGFYSRAVGETAAEAGISTLFTSDPTPVVRRVQNCRLLGRYFVKRGMGPEMAASFAGGFAGPRLRQAALWKARKVVKTVAGGLYEKVRRSYLERQACHVPRT
jgi:peptidoglycan/xylan/chitin deacetylase (PgdA/CDA1 family)